MRVLEPQREGFEMLAHDRLTALLETLRVTVQVAPAGADHIADRPKDEHARASAIRALLVMARGAAVRCVETPTLACKNLL